MVNDDPLQARGCLSDPIHPWTHQFVPIQRKWERIVIIWGEGVPMGWMGRSWDMNERCKGTRARHHKASSPFFSFFPLPLVPHPFLHFSLTLSYRSLSSNWLLFLLTLFSHSPLLILPFSPHLSLFWNHWLPIFLFPRSPSLSMNEHRKWIEDFNRALYSRDFDKEERIKGKKHLPVRIGRSISQFQLDFLQFSIR